MPRLSSHFALKDPRFQSLVYPLITVTTLTDAAATLTAAQVQGGLILCPASTGRTLTLPTAALLSDAIQGGLVGTAFEFTIRNTGAGTVTVAAGTGGTTSGTMTVATTASKRFLVLFTNVTVGSEAFTIYSLGSSTF